MLKSKAIKLIFACYFCVTAILGCGVGMTTTAYAETSNASKVYVYNLGDFLNNDSRCTFTGEDGKVYVTKYGYDFLKMAAVLQGIVNRNSTGDKIFYIYEASSEIAQPRDFHPDYYWLDKLNKPGQSLENYIQVIVQRDRFYQDLLSVFKDKIKGIAIWSDSIPATSNVASTISGADDYLPARAGGELYAELKAQLGSLPEINLDTKFAGSYTNIPDTDIPGTGSKKNDAYLWAVEKYVKTGKVNPRYVTYAVDAYSKLSDETHGTYYKNDMFNRMLINADYFISNRSFFVDLSPIADVVPNDDPTQNMGTDVDTYNKVFQALRDAAGTDIITVGGFSQWDIKYSSEAAAGQKDPIYSEWNMVDLISKYYAQLDADAPGLMGLANASIYRHVPLKDSFVQPNDKGVNNKTYDPNKKYVCFYMGDFDSAAWTAGELPALWDKPNGRGRIPLAWSIVPNLSDRVPQMYNYMYETATPKDYFISGDNGAGYLNSIELPDQYMENWKTYNKNLFSKFDLSITGFVITDWTSKLPLNIQQMYSSFAPVGVGVNSSYDSKMVNGVPFVKVQDMTNGHTPKNAQAVVQGLSTDIGADTKFIFLRTILADPDILADGVEQYLASNPDVEVVDPYTFYRFYKQADQGSGQQPTQDITSAEFNANGGTEETQYIDQNIGNCPIDRDHRYSDGTNWWSYKFDLANDVASAQVEVNVGNEYIISASKDGENWTQLAIGKSVNSSHEKPRRTLTLDLGQFLTDNDSKTVYLKFQDSTSENGWGAGLYHLKLSTSTTPYDGITSDRIVFLGNTVANIGNITEGKYLYDDEGNDLQSDMPLRFADGNGYWTYKFNLADATSSASISMDIQNQYKISVSKDCSNWSVIDSDTQHDTNRSLRVYDISSFLADNPTKTVYVKLEDDDKSNGWGPGLYSIAVDTDAVSNTDIKGISFSATGNETEKKFLYNDSQSVINNDHRSADADSSWTYKFDLQDTAANAYVDLDINNTYQISASTDGSTWMDLANSTTVGNRQNLNLDLSPLLQDNPSKTVYLKFQDSTPADGNGPGLWSLNLYTEKKITSITLSSPKTFITDSHGSLQITAAVSPENAIIKDVVWSVANEDGTATDKASIDNTGLLTALKDGTVKVTATAADGSGVSSSIVVKLYGQDVPLPYLANITHAKFLTDGRMAELAYMAEEHSNGVNNDHRYADGNSYWTYKFDLADDADNASITADINNQYLISASNDGKNWTTIANTTDVTARTSVTLDIGSFVTPNTSNIVYIRFEDPEKTGGNGPGLWSLEISTTDSATNVDFSEKCFSADNRTTGFENGDIKPTWLGTWLDRFNVLNDSLSVVSDGNAYSGNSCLKFSGKDMKENASGVYYKVFDAGNLKINANTVLSYWFKPMQGMGTHSGVDMILKDAQGNAYTLRDSNTYDNNGIRMHPSEARGTIGEWSHVVCNLGPKHNGSTIDKILIAYDFGPNIGDFSAYFDDISIVDADLATSVTVNSENNSTVINTNGGTLQMSAQIDSADANGAVVWSVTDESGNPTSKAAISADGLLTAVGNGKVKVTATTTDGFGTFGYNTITISNQIVKVKEVAVISKTGVINSYHGTLRMYTSLSPYYANDGTVTWSVTDENGSVTDKANIDQTGTLTALKNGTVKVTATANDGSVVWGTKLIELSNQTNGTTSEQPGNSGTPASQAEARVIDSNGNIIKTVTSSLDTSAGIATVEMDASSLTQAFSTSEADGRGVKTVEVNIPKIDGAKAYEVILPTSTLIDGSKSETVMVKTDKASVTLNGSMLAEKDAAGAQKVSLTISNGDKSRLDAAVQTQIGNRPIIDVSLKINGKQTTWRNEKAPVTVSIPYTPTAEELKNPESIVVWYIDGSGNAVSIPNGHYNPAKGTVTFNTAHFSNYAIAFNKVGFKDVAANTWYGKAVAFIAARGITTGTGKGNYSPDVTITRGDFMVMLMRTYGIAPDAKPEDNFADGGNTYYTGYLAAAKRLGISDGVGNNMFAPGKKITRQEMFTLLYNVLKVMDNLPEGTSGKVLSDFSDKDKIAFWAKDAMTMLVKTGIISGSSGKLNPDETTSRAEMAQVLYNLLSK